MPNYLRLSQTNGAMVFDEVNNTLALDLDLLTSNATPPSFSPLDPETLTGDLYVEPLLYQLILWYMDRQSKAQDASLFIGAPVQGDQERRWNQSMSSIVRNGVQEPVTLATATIQILRMAQRVPNPVDLI